MTDSGSAYVSIAQAVACGALGIRHLRTRPHRPQTNGKAERAPGTVVPRQGRRFVVPIGDSGS
jgi:transposase InsO family protein